MTSKAYADADVWSVFRADARSTQLDPFLGQLPPILRPMARAGCPSGDAQRSRVGGGVSVTPKSERSGSAASQSTRIELPDHGRMPPNCFNVSVRGWTSCAKRPSLFETAQKQAIHGYCLLMEDQAFFHFFPCVWVYGGWAIG